jgi:alpha-beta hydrolase superfamily lysophospholipase
MTYSTEIVKVSDGLNIHLHQWIPENPDKLLFLIHGAVEHGKRYDYFAKKLNEQGFIVIAPDHRGHGLTAKESGEFSHLGDTDGFLRVVQDLNEILDHLIKKYPDYPRAIFGHSLGSFLSRQFISQRGQDFKAAILSGSSWGNTIELKGGLILTKIWSLFSDKNKVNQKFDDFLWGQLNAKVKNRKGRLDFINSDDKEVEKYIADPLNGKPITLEFGIQMSKGMLMIRENKVFENTPKDLNIYLASGLDDPLSNKGKDIHLIAEKYKNAGIKNITVKLYPDARHEIINEPNKDEIISEMISWLNSIFSTK